MALGLDEPRAPEPPPEGDVLERALAALVAHRAVERVIDEQELDDRILRVVHPVGLGVDDHPVLHRGGARGLELGDALDLDQAHPARADRLPELRLVAEVGDLDVALLGGVDQHHALGRAHLAAVDRQLDDVLWGAGHSGRLSSAPGKVPRARPRPRPGSRPPHPPPRRAHAPLRSRPRAPTGTSGPLRRSAWPSRRRGRRGSCR